jgi:hypothetical protein
MDNTKYIAEQIFTKLPQPKNTIELGLEEQTAGIAEKTGIDKFIFEILTVITMHGIEILFGHKNILELTESNFNLINEYTNSFGYNIVKKIDEKSKVLFISFNRLK